MLEVEWVYAPQGGRAMQLWGGAGKVTTGKAFFRLHSQPCCGEHTIIRLACVLCLPFCMQGHASCVVVETEEISFDW